MALRARARSSPTAPCTVWCVRWRSGRANALRELSRAAIVGAPILSGVAALRAARRHLRGARAAAARAVAARREASHYCARATCCAVAARFRSQAARVIQARRSVMVGTRICGKFRRCVLERFLCAAGYRREANGAAAATGPGRGTARRRRSTAVRDHPVRRDVWGTPWSLWPPPRLVKHGQLQASRCHAAHAAPLRVAPPL